MLTGIAAKRAAGVAGVVVCGLLTAGTALAHDMIEVGVTASKKQLLAHYDITFPIPIEESFIDSVPGWAAANLGFEALLFDDEIEGVFKLPGDCDLRVKVVGYDQGVFLWNDHTTAPLGVGEAFTLGVPYFHTHPIWQITEPGFDKSFNVVLALEDVTGHYETSEPFTVSFTPVPAPGAIGLVGAAGLLTGRRRR